ncbi:DnaJ domain-containing protein [Cellulophaga sp. HaHaR_3_176]|uniref:DnaJ domain-containing protein n=1 Tax=Cellulophaga sp. HaHaR_3_176 TaxID=1942464 RepID=UPI001C1F72E3|nr:DnaJ domain-containing protein [Cellulophaga sp. HaHaR_3_176]QWX82646.1 DnaJ domain-containing protein [Cellulophaga sp. HaHaR_3_176]
MFKDYYDIQKIVPPVTAEEIKKAFRSQCMIWHPKKNPDIRKTKRLILKTLRFNITIE